MNKDQCTRRIFAWDADSNRTSTTTRPRLTSDLSCATTDGATQNWTYDTADRVNTSGYTYDVLGRTLQVPSVDSGVTTTFSYYVNDRVRTMNEGATTQTLELDALARIRTSNSTGSSTRINHYSGDGDSPSWTSSDPSAGLWARSIGGFDGLALSLSNAPQLAAANATDG